MNMRLPKPRKLRRKTRPPKGYDSHFEHELHMGVLKGCKHHPDRIKYTVEREYEPDFIYSTSRETILIEVKGRFRDRSESSKYIWIAKALPKQYRLVFVFMNPSLPMPFAKKRKCGTKQTHAEWAEKNGFTYYTAETVPRIWGVKRR